MFWKIYFWFILALNAAVIFVHIKYFGSFKLDTATEYIAYITLPFGMAALFGDLRNGSLAIPETSVLLGGETRSEKSETYEENRFAHGYGHDAGLDGLGAPALCIVQGDAR